MNSNKQYMPNDAVLLLLLLLPGRYYYCCFCNRGICCPLRLVSLRCPLALAPLSSSSSSPLLPVPLFLPPSFPSIPPPCPSSTLILPPPSSLPGPSGPGGGRQSAMPRYASRTCCVTARATGPTDLPPSSSGLVRCIGGDDVYIYIYHIYIYIYIYWNSDSAGGDNWREDEQGRRGKTNRGGCFRLFCFSRVHRVLPPSKTWRENTPAQSLGTDGSKAFALQPLGDFGLVAPFHFYPSHLQQATSRSARGRQPSRPGHIQHPTGGIPHL